MPDPDPIAALLDAAPVLRPDADLTDVVVRRLIVDLAQKIYPPEEIALRYGFASLDQLRMWMQRHPQVVAEAKRLQALNESDDSVKDRGALKAAHVVDQTIDRLGAIILDPTASNADRISAFKEARTTAGIDARRGDGKEGGAGGGQFAVNFYFSDGRRETLSTTVVPLDLVPALVEDADA